MSQAHLVPAFIIAGRLGQQLVIGTLSTGSQKSYTNVTSGSLVGIPSAPAPFSFLNFTTVVVAGDWLTVDPDGQHARLDVRGTLRNDEGDTISMEYPGIIGLSDPEVQKVFTGSADAKTTGWGVGITTPTFSAGNGKWKFLEDNIWVGSVRFVVDDVEGPNKGFGVEYRVSQVVGDRK